MPSPRFSRLPPEKRARILAVARMHLARDGIAGASYNRIIADAEISKTTAYLYFDGKEDLVAEVRRELTARLAEVMGPWEPASSPRRFWSKLTASAQALHQHLLGHPDDLALLGQVPPDAEANDPLTEAWFTALLEDGIRLGVIRDDVDRPLMLAATRALFRVSDEYVLERLHRGDEVDLGKAWTLLRGLWAAPPRAPRKGRA